MNKTDNKMASHKAILRTYLPLFKLFRNLSKKDQLVLLPHLDEISQEAICSVISSCVQKAKLSKKKKDFLKKKLSKQKAGIRALSRDNGKLSKSQKNDLLIQLGGSPLSLLLSAAIPLISSLLK